VPFFLIGATARDFILTHGYKIASPRATLDIDIGIRVPDWDQFMKLRQDLLISVKVAETKEIHRLRNNLSFPNLVETNHFLNIGNRMIHKVFMAA